MTSSHQNLVLRMYAAISAGATGDELATYFHPEAQQIEYPSVMRPHGHRRGLAEMRQGAEIGTKIIADQHYEVHTMVEDGDRLAVQFTWTATVTADLGAIPTGTRLVSHVAAFYIIRDGLVLEQSSYDCYEPIASSVVNL